MKGREIPKLVCGSREERVDAAIAIAKELLVPRRQRLARKLRRVVDELQSECIELVTRLMGSRDAPPIGGLQPLELLDEPIDELHAALHVSVHRAPRANGSASQRSRAVARERARIVGSGNRCG